jgi:DHA2 family multidrug resistance protein
MSPTAAVPPAAPAVAPAALPPLTGLPLAIASLVLALGTFMQVLDTTIANVSLTTIAGNLGVSADTSTWVITAFAVSNGVTVPLTGWLMRRFGTVRTFVASVFLFTIASFLCGIAWSLPALIFFRILQGAVSGPMMPGSQALLMAIFPPHKRATALGIWSITTLVAPIAGPILGGYISDNYHWGWIFLINVPVGLVVGWLSWRLLRTRESATFKIPVDVGGLMLLVFWVGALQIMLDLGKNADWFNSTTITILGLCAIVGFVAWLIWELTDSSPAVDLRLFARRNFVLGNIAFCLGYAVFFGNILLLPLWLQQQLGYTATWAGLVLAPSGVVAVIFTPVLARLAGKIDVRWLATLAFVAFAVSYFMRAEYTAQADYWSLALPLAVQGISLSTFFLAMLTISLDGIPPEKLPSATGISNFVRITVASFAASLTATIWDRRAAFHQSRLVEVTTPYAPNFAQSVDHANALGLTDPQSHGVVMRQIVGQAYLLSSTEIFWVCGWLSCIMIVLIWLTRRPGNGAVRPLAAD